MQDQQESSCDSHVTPAVTRQPDHVTTLPLEPQAQLKEAQLGCPQNSGLYIGDVELSIDDHTNCCGVDFEFQSSASSSQSPAKPALDRPDALCLPSSLPRHQHSLSSISTASASPPSSTCSHSSPPLPLSPSPTPPCEGVGLQQEDDITREHSEPRPEAAVGRGGAGECSGEREESCLQPEGVPQDEWPDLCPESSSAQLSPLTQQYTAITKSPEAQPDSEGASNLEQWPLPFTHLLSHPQTVPPFACPPPVLPSSASPMVYCLQSTVYWPQYPSALQPHPQPHPHPHPHPQTTDIRLPQPQPPDVHPPQPDAQPQSPRPQSPRPQSLRPQSPRPQSPQPQLMPGWSAGIVSGS